MRTSTRLVRAAALPLAATLLVACGGGGDSASSGGSGDASADPSSSTGSDSSSAYCDDLRDAQESFAAFDSADPEPAQLQEAFDTFRSLAAEAPSEVKEEWATIDTAVEQVQKSLDEVGLDIGDLSGLQSGQLPEGVTPQDLQKLAADLQSLGNEDFAAAGQAIQEHAKSECDVDLGGASSSASPSASPSS